MKTIWIVSLWYYTPQDSAQTRWVGGNEKRYAVFSNKSQAIKVRDLIRKMSNQKLIELKIIKQGEELNEVVISHPYAVDNYDNIVKKLTSV